MDTEFFGIKACYEKVNELDATDDKGHLLSLQFVLQNKKTLELIAMDVIGPIFADDLVICQSRKLELENYSVDEVTYY